MASDAASGDFQAAGDSCGVYPTERQAKDFRSTRRKFYGVLGIASVSPVQRMISIVVCTENFCGCEKDADG